MPTAAYQNIVFIEVIVHTLSPEQFDSHMPFVPITRRDVPNVLNVTCVKAITFDPKTSH